MSKYEAKIETIANREFLYRGIKYEKGDIFQLNPNDRLHKTFLRNKRVYVLPEEHYEYVCTKPIKEFFGIIYKQGDVVDFSEIPEHERLNKVRQGNVKKVIKKLEEDKEEKISYSAYAKSKNMTYTELKKLYKEKYDEYLPHHMSAVSNEVYKKMEIIIPKE